MKKSQPNFRDDIKCYAPLPENIEVWSEYVIDEFIRASNFATLINASCRGVLYFDSDYSYQIMKKLNKMVILLEKQKLSATI
jgi:hypothetical protein